MLITILVLNIATLIVMLLLIKEFKLIWKVLNKSRKEIIEESRWGQGELLAAYKHLATEAIKSVKAEVTKINKACKLIKKKESK